MNKSALKTIVCAMALGYQLTGCASLQNAPQTVVRYTIDYPAPQVESETPLAAVIKVERFGAAPGFNCDQMVWAANAFERNTYAYRRWFSPPAEMVGHVLARDFDASHLFSAVTHPGDRFPATHVLTGSVTDFYEKDDHNAWRAVLGISILFFSESKRPLRKEILLTKQYRAEVACNRKNAAAFAVAMNSAVQTLSTEIRQDLKHAIADSTDK